MLENKIIVSIWSLLLLLTGISYLMSPIIDGWSEVYLAPWINNTLFWLALDAVIIILLLFQLIFLGYKLILAKCLIYKQVIFSLVTIVILGSVLSFLDVKKSDLRILGFQVGAKSKIRSAGGKESIIEDSLQFLQSEDQAAEALVYPDSLSQLGATRVTLDKELRFVNIQIRSRDSLSDQFGYLINHNQLNHLDFEEIMSSSNFRIWEIEQRIYLYEKW